MKRKSLCRRQLAAAKEPIVGWPRAPEEGRKGRMVKERVCRPQSSEGRMRSLYLRCHHDERTLTISLAGPGRSVFPLNQKCGIGVAAFREVE